jgi:hypothetical protein
MAIAITTGVAACNGDDGGETSGGAPEGCFDYGSFTATPNVSLRTDVMPIFQNSCTFSGGCHGTVSASSGRVYLGPAAGISPTEENIQAMLAQNKGVAASVSSMPRITPGDASQSFLMHKVDGTLTCADLDCAANTSCGMAMPFNSPPLAAADANKIRSWIEQGAADN